MNIRIVILGLLLICSNAYAQEVKKQGIQDSLKTTVSAQPTLTEPVNSSYRPSLQPNEGFSTDLLPSSVRLDASGAAGDSCLINPKAVEMPPLQTPFLVMWNGGMMAGYHGSEMGSFAYSNVAGVDVFQQWGNLSMLGGLSMSHGIYNVLGISNGISSNLMLAYRLSGNISVNAFGGLGNAGFLSPAPNITNAYYGGYLTFMTNNHKWGMDMGVRRVYNSITGNWETIPIAMPYYNLGGAKLGVDVGGLLYNTFHEAINRKNVKSGKVDPSKGATIIGPPIDTKIEMRPMETPKWVEKQYGNQF